MSAFSENNFNASEYFRDRPRYSKEIFELFYSWHNLHGNANFDTILDIGCGPGTFTYPLSLKFKNVIGLDPSEIMLQQAKSVNPEKDLYLPEKPKGHSIKFIQGSGESIDSLPDQSVDSIVSSAAIHWLKGWEEDEGSSIWKEFSRILKPNGTIFFLGHMTPSIEGYDLINSELMIDILYNQDKLNKYYSRGSKLYKIMASYLGSLPKPKGEKWIEDETSFITFNIDKNAWPLAYDYSLKDLPEWAKNVINKDGNKPKPLLRFKSEFIKLFEFLRSISGYVKYLNDHPEEKEKVLSNDDALIRWAKPWISAQAKKTASLKLGKEEKDITEEEAEKYKLQFHQEVELFFGVGLFLARRGPN